MSSAARRFVFLDRDGTLVRDRGYVHRVQDYALLPGVIDGLWRIREAGYGLAIVTNQSGIGRGYFSETDFQAFQRRLLEDLGAAGVEIEASYFCPHRPDERCDCRKPEPGMLERARQELGADLAQSWVIGDSDADCGLARNAGCGFVRVGASEDGSAGPELRARDLVGAAEAIAKPPG